MSFTPEQVGALSAKLDGSVVRKRQQAGRSFSYIEGWHAIAEANRIFGFDRWHRETVEMRQLGEPREVDGKWRVGYMAKVKIEVFAGERAVIREGCGYGSGIDKDVGSAHESALKEAETDAMKRALMTFGNPFGLALYDKDQENVEHAKPAPALPPRPAHDKPAMAPPQNGADHADHKALAAGIRDALTGAETLDRLQIIMDLNRATIGTLPQVTANYLEGIYHKRKAAMESVT